LAFSSHPSPPPVRVVKGLKSIKRSKGSKVNI
jgi:hypothetical protein